MANLRLPGLIVSTLRSRQLITPAPGWRAELAPGGSADRTFAVLRPDGTPALTVRLGRPGLATWLRHELDVLRELAADPAACSPRAVATIDEAAFPEGLALVHEHVPGMPRALTQVSAAEREQLGVCLAGIHRHQRSGYVIWPKLEPNYGTRADNLRERIDSLQRYAAVMEMLPESQQIVEHMRVVTLPASSGWHASSFALLHGDLSTGNILWSEGTPRLIDWEFARDGDPAEDLAYLVAEQALAPEHFADIAEGYVIATGDAWVLARVPLWLPLVALDAALWWADELMRAGGDASNDPRVVERISAAREYAQRLQ